MTSMTDFGQKPCLYYDPGLTALTNSDDTRSQQRGGVAIHAELGEDSRRIVQHRVDTSPLLEKHGDGGHNDPTEHGHAPEEGTNGHELELERVPPVLFGKVREIGLHRPLLEHRLGLDLEELQFDGLVIKRSALATQFGNDAARLLLAAVVDKPTRRVRHEKHTDEQNDRRRQLQAQRDQPGGLALGVSSAADVVGAVVDPEGNHDSKLDRELLDTNQHASNFRRRALGVIYKHLSVAILRTMIPERAHTHWHNHPCTC